MTVDFPTVTAATAGVLLILQTLLGFAVSGARGKLNIWIGAGSNAALERAQRRHANLAENAGLFVAGFTLFELSGRWPTLLVVLCVAFVAVRLFHAAGLSLENSQNALRMIGGAGTFLLGLILGGTLRWIGLTALLGSHA